MPAVSVVVPVYCAERYLSECIESILSQTLTDIELILVDDGSNDNSPLICDEFAKKDARIRVIHKKNGGVTSARKAGLAMASAQYIGFVDADDYISPTMFEQLYQAMTSYQADYVECGYRRVENGPEECIVHTKNHVLEQQDIHRKVLVPLLEETGQWNCFLTWSCCNKLYRTKLLSDAMTQDDETIAIGEDFLQNVFYLACCNRAVLIADAGEYYYRRSDTSVMRSKSIHIGEVAYLKRAISCVSAWGYTGNGLCRSMTYRILSDLLTLLYYSKQIPVTEKKQATKMLLALIETPTEKEFFSQYIAEQGLLTKILVSMLRIGIGSLQLGVFMITSIISKDKYD